jgi:ribA/ribD-fused uncharacterized protein
MEKAERERIIEAEKNDVVTRGEVTLFWGGWASQWYPSDFVVDDVTFNCAEQFMMFSKAIFFGDTDTATKVLGARWPKQQKELGRMAGPWNPAWDEPEGSRVIVLRGTLAKFRQNPRLRKALMGTGESIIAEASPVDAKWGIGLGMDDGKAWDPAQWRGTNWLGKALMQARTLLRDEGYDDDGVFKSRR